MSQLNFFSFGPLQTDQGIVKTEIHLNSAHPIFSGHFPGNPVLPGVCMMQMVKEVVENHLGSKIKLVKASELKFLSFVVPDDNKTLQLELKITAIEDDMRVDAKLKGNDNVLFKFKGTFVPR